MQSFQAFEAEIESLRRHNGVEVELPRAPSPARIRGGVERRAPSPIRFRVEL